MKKKNNINSDTIAAISTSIGEGGIGIVRLSGYDALSITGKIFFSSKIKDMRDCKSHTIHYGFIKSPADGAKIDEVLVTVMRAPMTYTAEDVVEINCHGGVVTVKKILELCLGNGARLADPGEFTKRAFVNGRIDLSQAEAVLDVIEAKSDAAQKIAMDNLEGIFSTAIKKIKEDALNLLSLIELSIDFSDEDVKFTAPDKIVLGLNSLKKEIKSILDTFERGLIMRKGVHLVICGKTNVGKSSLMNALMKKDRVIVTPMSGTTRDVVEESVNIKGINIRISDTAGIVSTDDVVESEGIKRSKEAVNKADIVLFVLDSSRKLDEQDDEIYSIIRDKKKIIVVNKIDLEKMFSIEEVFESFDAECILGVSALKGEGIADIEESIADRILGGETTYISNGPVVSNIRHKDALERSLTCLDRAISTSFENYVPELLASDINDAISLFGQITGETVDDDILDRIFSKFCIGK